MGCLAVLTIVKATFVEGAQLSDTTDWTASTFGEGNPVITIVSGAGGVVSANTGRRCNI